jgi:hypothetical protein
MIELIPVDRDSSAVLILRCGHTESISINEAADWRRLGGGCETVCLQCPIGDGIQLIADVIVRHG